LAQKLSKLGNENCPKLLVHSHEAKICSSILDVEVKAMSTYILSFVTPLVEALKWCSDTAKEYENDPNDLFLSIYETADNALAKWNKEIGK